MTKVFIFHQKRCKLHPVLRCPAAVILLPAPAGILSHVPGNGKNSLTGTREWLTVLKTCAHDE